MKTIVRIGLTAAALALFANTAAAQTVLPNIPVYAPSFQGLLISGDWGMGANDDAKFGSTSSPMTIGGAVGYGAGMFNVLGGVGYVNTKNDMVAKPISFGGQVNVTVFQPAESPLSVSVLAGAGYTSFKDTTSAGNTLLKNLSVPFGVGIAFAPPTSGSINFKLFAAPRGVYLSQDPGADKASRFGFGVSGGVAVTFAQGFGLHGAVDWSTFSEKTEGTSVYPKISPLVFGLGAHYVLPIGPSSEM